MGGSLEEIWRRSLAEEDEDELQERLRTAGRG